MSRSSSSARNARISQTSTSQGGGSLQATQTSTANRNGAPRASSANRTSTLTSSSRVQESNNSGDLNSNDDNQADNTLIERVGALLAEFTAQSSLCYDAFLDIWDRLDASSIFVDTEKPLSSLPGTHDIPIANALRSAAPGTGGRVRGGRHGKNDMFERDTGVGSSTLAREQAALIQRLLAHLFLMHACGIASTAGDALDDEMDADLDDTLANAPNSADAQRRVQQREQRRERELAASDATREAVPLKTRVGVVYALYLTYFAQPHQPRFKIPLPEHAFDVLVNTVTEALSLRRSRSPADIGDAALDLYRCWKALEDADALVLVVSGSRSTAMLDRGRNEKQDESGDRSQAASVHLLDHFSTDTVGGVVEFAKVERVNQTYNAQKERILETDLTPPVQSRSAAAAASAASSGLQIGANPANVLSPLFQVRRPLPFTLVANNLGTQLRRALDTKAAPAVSGASSSRGSSSRRRGGSSASSSRKRAMSSTSTSARKRARRR